MHSDVSIYVAFSRESFIRRPLYRKRSAPEDARLGGMGEAKMMTRGCMERRMKDEQKKMKKTDRDSIVYHQVSESSSISSSDISDLDSMSIAPARTSLGW
jgi:hypothetical protein